MSDQEGKPTDYLQLTREWFKKQFGRELNDDQWEKIRFESLEDKVKGSVCWALGTEQVATPNDALELCESLIRHLKLREAKGLVPLNTLNPLKDQFAIEYRGEVAERLLKRVDSCYAQWTSTTSYYAPYISLVQSSGYGKSRACKEIALDPSWLTVFVCCRPKDLHGYPPRTQGALNFFDSVQSYNQLKAICAMKLWLEWLLYCRRLFRLMFSYTIDMRTMVRNIMNKNLEDLVAEFNKDGPTDLDKEKPERHAFWTLFVDPDESADIVANQLMFLFIEGKVRDNESPPKYDDGRSVLIVIDEARYLVERKLERSKDYSLFRIFQTSIEQFKNGLFAIVVDTHPRVASFSPSLPPHPWFRTSVDEDDAQSELFAPFTAVVTTDELRDPQGNCDDPKYRFTLGRPLWKTSFLTPNVDLKMLLDFAQRKLFGGLIEPNDCGKVACMAVLTGMNIFPFSPTAKELVASHMATCLAIDAKSDSVLVKYPLEPVLAEAAKGYIQQCKNLSEVFEELLNFFRIGSVDRGHGCELVAKILLLLGQFKVSRRGSLFSCCQEMFKALFGDLITQRDVMHDEDQFSFNCFTELYGNEEYWSKSEPQEELKLFFNRGAAIQLPRLDLGTELLLPIRKKLSTGEHEYKYLLFQVKDQQYELAESKIETHQTKLESALDGTLWAGCDIGFSVVMDLGQDIEESFWCSGDTEESFPCLENTGRDSTGKQQRKDRQFLVVKGLGFGSYKVLENQGDTVQALKRMLREPSVLDWATEDVTKEATEGTSSEQGMIKLCPVSLRSLAFVEESL